eukprot:1574265-Pyramimonas_sp.AAC.1
MRELHDRFVGDTGRLAALGADAVDRRAPQCAGSGMCFAEKCVAVRRAVQLGDPLPASVRWKKERS